jgi:hypothetical protein
MEQEAKSAEMKNRPETFEQGARRILAQHSKGMRLQLSNLGYGGEFDLFLDRIDRLAEVGD